MIWNRSSGGTSMVSTSAWWTASPIARRSASDRPARSDIRTSGMMSSPPKARGGTLGLHEEECRAPGYFRKIDLSEETHYENVTMLPNLNMDLLRTVAVAMELGSFARAAERLGRTPSAVSLQMRRLEAQLDRPLFRKQGRGLALTDAGDVVLSYARRILALNDEAVAAVTGIAVDGAVRLGGHQEFAEGRLPSGLAPFARSHPAVQIEG